MKYQIIDLYKIKNSESFSKLFFSKNRKVVFTGLKKIFYKNKHSFKNKKIIENSVSYNSYVQLKNIQYISKYNNINKDNFDVIRLPGILTSYTKYENYEIIKSFHKNKTKKKPCFIIVIYNNTFFIKNINSYHSYSESEILHFIQLIIFFYKKYKNINTIKLDKNIFISQYINILNYSFFQKNKETIKNIFTSIQLFILNNKKYPKLNYTIKKIYKNNELIPFHTTLLNLYCEREIIYKHHLEYLNPKRTDYDEIRNYYIYFNLFNYHNREIQNVRNEYYIYKKNMFNLNIIKIINLIITGYEYIINYENFDNLNHIFEINNFKKWNKYITKKYNSLIYNYHNIVLNKEYYPLIEFILKTNYDILELYLFVYTLYKNTNPKQKIYGEKEIINCVNIENNITKTIDLCSIFSSVAETNLFNI